MSAAAHTPAGLGEPADALQLPTDATPAPANAAFRRAQLSRRDLAVLHDIGALQLATARQIERLRFQTGSTHTQTRRARRTLQRLHTLGLLARLDRRIGGAHAGSAGYIYRLTPKARALLGLPGPQGGRRRQLHQPTPQRSNHILAVAEVAVRLVEAHRSRRLELVRFEAEPHSWRTWTGLAGETCQLRPDAFAIVATGEWEHLWFLEIDLGTEHPATLERKAASYRAYARSGAEQHRWGVFPRVAYLATTPARVDALTRLLRATPDADRLLVVAHLPNAVHTLTGDQP